jgi:hypothetical protein
MPHERIAMSCPPVMHPLPVPLRLDQAGAFQMPQMSRDFRLHDAQRVGQLADARLSAGEEIEQTQARRIS